MSSCIRPQASSRFVRLVARSFFALVLLGAVAALADDDKPVRRYGYRPSPDFEREYAERLRVLPVDKQLPESFNWLPYLTPAKDQGDCGSCWSFAAMGQIEAHMKINYGANLDLSEQQGIDCNPYGADCGGGWASAVYNFAQTYGVVREEAIPYIGGENPGCAQWDYIPFAHLTDWYYVSNNVNQIKTALLDGPVCSSVQAEGVLDDYVSGCISYPGGIYTDHLIVIVGWDDRACDFNGGWICKNSWGADFGDGGLFTIEYGSAMIGSGVTQIQLMEPDVELTLLGPDDEPTYLAGDEVTISWITGGAGCSTVDVWFGENGAFTTQVADGIPNTGSITWNLPNVTTDRARFCVIANGDTRDGFEISDRYSIIGHKSVYVSSAGSNTFPYDSPATAAHDINDALTACAGHDSVLVAGDDYTGPIGVSGTTWVIGGWNPTFSVKDPGAYPTRITSVTSCMLFVEETDGHTGVEGFEFHDGQGTISSTPSYGMHGGGVYVSGSSPVIRDCLFTDNTAEPFGGYGVGGGIAVFGGSPTIEGCEFSGNAADVGGAIALFDAADAVITDCTFTGNACKSTDMGQHGAAVYAEGGSLSFAGNTATGQIVAHRGGALYANGCPLDMANNHLAGNQALDAGGAVAVFGGGLTLVGGRFDANGTGVDGGAAIWIDGGDAAIRNAVFTDNVAETVAAAILLENVGDVEVGNCLFTGNVVTTGFSLGSTGVLTGASLLYRNNVAYGNPAGGVGGGVTTHTVDYNVFWNNSLDYQGLTPGAHDLQAEPLFVDAAGGDWSLALHSPCLDRGDPDAACLDPDGSRNDAGPCGGPSADFLAPSYITGAVLTDLGDDRNELSWDASVDPGVVSYVVYRSSDDPFLPGADKVIHTVAHPNTSWIDESPDGGSYYVVALDAAGRVGGYSDKLTPSTSETGADLPRVLAVTGVKPNPFNPRTTVSFALPRDGRVTVRVHDMRGRTVRTLVDGPLPAGRHETVWDGRSDAGTGVATGVYLVRVHDGTRAETAKLMLAK